MQNPASVAALVEESLALERAGDIATALSRSCQALDLARSGGKSEEIASALVSVARYRYRLQQYPAACALAQEALTQAVQDSPARADALLMLGMCAADTESLTEAEEHYRNAADLAHETGQHLLRFRALHNLGTTVYMPRGQFDLALAASKEALRLARQHNLNDWLSYPLITLAWIYQYTGETWLARQALDELNQVACVAAINQGFHPNTLALLALDEGDLEAAPALFAQARTAAEMTGDQGLAIDMRMGMSRYHRLSGNVAAARDWADDALKLTCRTNKKQEQGQALIERSRAAWALADLATAEADLRAAIDVLKPLQANFDLARAALLLAALLHNQRHPEAHKAWKKAAHFIINGGYGFLLQQERTLAYPLVAAHLNDPDPETSAISTTLLTHLERVPPPPLEVITLGKFEVRQGRRIIGKQTWGKRRAGELFALLLTSPGHSLTAEQAAEALSPEKPPDTAQIVVNHATSELRRLLEPELPDRRFPSRYLEVNNRLISLRLPAGSRLDFEAFEQAVRLQDWEQALALFGGEFLPEFRYADWAASRREQISDHFRQVLLAIARDRLLQEDWFEALDFARRLIALDPWHEEAVLIAMHSCQAMDDLSGARRHFKRLEKTLWEELGVPPQEELSAFYQTLVKRQRK
ncbi:MAG: tetratricopeptide repeat protein [Anaerolineales bacterium]|nr:tetratricopeptide repeat protein [Anaerolineales bacterium]